MGDFFGDFSQGWVRGLIITVILLAVGFRGKLYRMIEKKDLKWFVVISVCGGLNQAPYFIAFKNLPIGTATLLFYAALTIGGYILGKFFFNEKITLVKIISLVLATIGLGMIFTLNLQLNQILPALFSVIAGLMGSMEVVFTKKISFKYSTVEILTGTFLVMFLGNLAISMLLAMYAVVVGYKHIEPSVAGLVGLSEVMFAVVFGLLLFGEMLTISVIIGGILILLSVGLPNVRGLLDKSVKSL